MSDSAYSDLAPVTYAVVLHRTFGWKLPQEKETVEFLLSRQWSNGDFFSVSGTVDPKSAEGRVYNTTQGIVALRALGLKPRYNPLPVFEEILQQDYKTLPVYSTSFFPLAYLAYGQPIPRAADQRIRATMVQAEDGYLNDHIAATFHAAHYYRLIGEPTPLAAPIIERTLRDQKADGSWMLNMPSRDRHATFDAVFTLRQLGHDRKDCRHAIEKAARWALTCRNPDGGFGHFPGSTSDADANYFHVGLLVMAGFLKPVSPLPDAPHLLAWGHLMPLFKTSQGSSRRKEAQLEDRPSAPLIGASLRRLLQPGWISSVAFSPDGKLLASACSDNTARLLNASDGKEIAVFKGHRDYVCAIAFAPDGKTLATGSYDHSVRLWDVESSRTRSTLEGHKGVVMSVAFSPDGKSVATASVDTTIKLWSATTDKVRSTLRGHKSWVNSVVFSPDGKAIVSGSSDGTVKIWDVRSERVKNTLDATDAEVRSVAISPDGNIVAAGIRYGKIKVWHDGRETLDFKAHESDVWSVAFTPDGSALISGDGDWKKPGPVKLWDPRTGKLLSALQHTGEVLSVACSPDGKRVAAGAGDNTLKVWDISKLVEVSP